MYVPYGEVKKKRLGNKIHLKKKQEKKSISQRRVLLKNNFMASLNDVTVKG